MKTVVEDIVRPQLSLQEHVQALRNADSIEEAGRYLRDKLGVDQGHIDFLARIGGTPKLVELYYEAILFDLKYGTNTCVFIPENVMRDMAAAEPQKFAKPENAEHGVKHRPSLTSAIVDGLTQAARLLRDKGIDIREASFFDFGTGTGKPVFIARHPDFGFEFKTATGVDYFEPVLDEARKNKSKIMGHDPNVRFEFEDATTFRRFNGVNVVYMYNPFDEDIMKEVEKNLRRYAGKTLVVYNKPVHGEIFTRKGWRVENSLKSADSDKCVTIFSFGFEAQRILNPSPDVPTFEPTNS